MKLPGFIFTLLLTGLLCSGCRKGEEDPKISLRTRKARMSGDWQMESGRASLTLYSYSEMYSFDGSRVTIYSTPIYEPVIALGRYVLSLQIKNDGTFTFREDMSRSTLEASGTWNFNSGVGELKKKEAVVFTLDDIAKGKIWGFFLFNQWNTNFSYQIRELRHKRLVLTAGGTIAGFSNGMDLRFTIDYTFKQK